MSASLSTSRWFAVLECNELVKECCCETKDILQLRGLGGGDSLHKRGCPSSVKRKARSCSSVLLTV